MRFFEGDIYKDAAGREWYVVHAVATPKGERLLLVRRNMPMTNQWAISIDNMDGTATILEDIGPTTLYSENKEVNK